MLLVTRTPFRLVLSAEGNLWSPQIERQDSTTLVATIGYYTYTLITPGPGKGIRIISSDHGAAYDLLSCEHLELDMVFGVPKAAICYLNLCDGITVSLASQLPPTTGLGAANAAATALIKGLAFWSGLDLGAAEVADLAGNIDDHKNSLGVNKRDTYAIALGGLNVVRKIRNRISVEPFALDAQVQASLESSLMLFLAPYHNTATNTDANTAADAIAEMRPDYNAIQQINSRIQTALQQGDLEAYGQLLHQSRLTRPSRAADAAPMTILERGYRLARSLGAWGGALTENHNSGTLLLVCPLKYQKEVIETLTHVGLQYRAITLAQGGVELFQTMPWPTAQTWQELYVSRQEGLIPH